jgi:hypothetical protein
VTGVVVDWEVCDHLIDALLNKIVHFVELNLKDCSLFFRCDNFGVLGVNIDRNGLFFESLDKTEEI